MKSKRVIDKEKKAKAAHKKNDDDPERGSDFVEDKLKSENKQKIDLLAN